MGVELSLFFPECEPRKMGRVLAWDLKADEDHAGMSESGVCRKRDSPEVARFIVLLHKLDPVSRDSLCGGQLCNDTGSDLSAAFVTYQDNRANYEITT